MGIMNWNDGQEAEVKPEQSKAKDKPKQRRIEAKPRQQEIKMTSKQGGVCIYCGGKGWTDFGKCDICRGSGRR